MIMQFVSLAIVISYISVYGKTFEEKFFAVTKTPPLTENFVVAWRAQSCHRYYQLASYMVMLTKRKHSRSHVASYTEKHLKKLQNSLQMFSYMQYSKQANKCSNSQLANKQINHLSQLGSKLAMWICMIMVAI